MATRKSQKKTRQFNVVPQQLIGVLAGLATLLLCFRRVILTNRFGDTGSAYYMAAGSLFFLLFSGAGLGYRYAVSAMVRARLERESAKSARQAANRAAVSGALVSLLLGVAGYAGAELLCAGLLQVPLAALAFKAFLPALLPLSVYACLTGGMDGFGSRQLPRTIDFLFYVGLLLTGPLLTGPFFEYGQKVGALLQNQQYGPAYGAMGAALSLFLAAFLAMLVSCFGWWRMKEGISLLNQPGDTRYYSDKRIYAGVFRTSLPVLLPFVLVALALSAQTGLFFAASTAETFSDSLTSYGVLTGKSGVLLALPLIAALSFALHMIPELKVAFARRNYKRSREKTMIMLRCCALMVVPFMVLFLVLPDALLGAFFSQGDLEQAAGLLRTGSLCVLFICFAISLAVLLSSTDLLLYLAVDLGVGVVLHLAALYVMLRLMKLGIYGLLYANLIFAFVCCLLFLYSIRRHLHLGISWLRVLLAPLIGGLIMAAVCGIFAHVLLKSAPSPVTALVSTLAGFLFYLVSVIVLHGATPRELRAFPGGDRLIGLARLLRLM